MSKISKYIYISMGLIVILGMISLNFHFVESVVVRSPTLFSSIETYHIYRYQNCIQSSEEVANEVNAYDIFDQEPKDEPEKGYILIGLGLVIIFIILGVLYYYKKKREQEKANKAEAQAEERTEDVDISDEPILKTEKKDGKGSLGQSPVSLVEGKKGKQPPRELVMARKKMESGGSFTRKKALKLFHDAVDKEPRNIAYAADGIIPCLKDKDNIVKRETLLLVEKAVEVITDKSRDIIAEIINLLSHDDKAIRRAARTTLTVYFIESDTAGKLMLGSMETRYKAIVKECSQSQISLLHCISLNKFLVKLGGERKESIPDIMNIIMRCITYPIYRPEQSGEEEEELYKSSGYSICDLCKLAPETIPQVLPKILKVLSDTYIFENWNEDSESEDSMRSVYKNIFFRLTSGDPRDFINSLLKQASSSNKTLERLVRDRFTEMASQDFGLVLHSLIVSFESDDEIIRKNAWNMVERIGPIDPTVSSEILMKFISGKKERIAHHAMKALKILRESTAPLPLININPVLKMMDNPAHEIRQEAVALLGRVIEMDPSQANRCVKYIVKALEQEWGVRLEALSSLARISKIDPILKTFSIPFIIERMQDKHDQVRWRASNILNELGVDEGDVKHYESARRQMDLAKPKLEKIRKGTSLDIGEITHELSRAKEMMKATNYRQADLLATRTNDMLIDLQTRNKPKVDLIIKEKNIFKVGKHTLFKLMVMNTGMVHVFDISVGFSENVEIIEDAPVYLKAGGEFNMSLAWTPTRTGRMPLKVRCTFKNNSGAITDFNKDIWLDVLSEDFDLKEEIQEDTSLAGGVLWNIVLI